MGDMLHLEMFAIFRPSELNSDDFIAKQVEYSRIKRMCIFHMLTVRGLAGSEGASAPCMGLPGNAEAPLATHLNNDNEKH